MKKINDYFPKVLKEDVEVLFEPEYIYESLMKETDLDHSNADMITKEVCRFIITTKLQLITAPLLREIICFHLLKHKFEKERLQYTRIGLPYYDLDMMLMIGDQDIVNETIDTHIIMEYEAVKKLIEGI